ncbi:MAG: hypothetical protein WDO69_05835 [Pseudomonadota bacterium]
MALQTISGFPNLTDIVGELNLTNNAALQTVTGFPKLSQIGGTLTIRDSDVLTQFDGLKSLVNIGGNLLVKSKPVLADIAGLRSGTLKLNGLGSTYDISGNPNLLYCEVLALKNTLGVASYNDRSGANLGCTACQGAVCSGTVGGTALQSGTFDGVADLKNAADLAWMKNVVNLNGALHIDSSSLPAISGLGNLTTIGGDLTITNNSTLSNVGGLSGLQNVTGNVSIQSNPALANISGFSALSGITGYLYIYNNAALANLSGLTNLGTIGGYLNIYSNGQLANLDGLLNLTSIGDYLYIYANPNLTSMLNLIKPAGKLITLGNYLTVQSNASLYTCQPDALKAVLVAQTPMWSKAYTQAGNATCTKTCYPTGLCQ